MQTYIFDYNEYKKRTKKKFNFSFIILTLFIIALLITACFIQPKKQKTVYYFVSANSFFNYTDASKLSNEIQARSGAGYIHFDGKYHILVAFYTNKDDANSVVENIKEDYPTASVFSLELDKFYTNKKLTKSQNKLIKNISTNISSNIDTLYEYFLKYDKNEINLSQLSIIASNIEEDFTDLYNNYIDSFKSTKYSFSSTSLDYLNKIKNSIISIKTACKSDYISYELKYNLVCMSVNYSSFLSCF